MLIKFISFLNTYFFEGKRQIRICEMSFAQKINWKEYASQLQALYEITKHVV